MIDDRLDEKIEKLEKLAEEDHKMIRSLYIRARIASGLRIFYWTVIIAVAVGSYFVIQPYVDQFKIMYANLQKAQNTLNLPSFGNIFDEFKDKFRTSTSSQ